MHTPAQNRKTTIAVGEVVEAVLGVFSKLTRQAALLRLMQRLEQGK